MDAFDQNIKTISFSVSNRLLSIYAFATRML